MFSVGLPATLKASSGMGLQSVKSIASTQPFTTLTNFQYSPRVETSAVETTPLFNVGKDK